MKKDTKTEEKYISASNERQKHVDAVLNSTARKKIVVAGPGTGKTYLFKEVLQGKKNCITLTFINSLVEDLSLELCGLSEVKTLHSFARKDLHRFLEKVKVFPKLSIIIREDARILLNEEIDFDLMFHKIEENEQYIDFYKKRKKYYGGYYGFSDIIFAIVKVYEARKNEIPYYQQILVDEFQDFNKLEVALIDLLSEKSPILLAGDDDQALYDFKNATTDHIRERHSDQHPYYDAFSLPHCSRCTWVVVEAANDIIRMAKKNGLLNNRINKIYKYFNDKEKDRLSNYHPKIIHRQLFTKQFPFFIAKQIGKIAEEEKKKFSVLIISPFTIQVRDIVEGLKKKGFDNIKYKDDKQDEKEKILLDALEILDKEKNSNLGWRILLKLFLNDTLFESVIKETDKEEAKFISEIVDVDCKNEIRKMIKIYKAIKNDKQVEKEMLDSFLQMIGHDPYEIKMNYFKNKIKSNSQRLDPPGLRKITLKATTIESSKVLAADYVFITHLDDKYFIENDDKTNISDRDVCKFLVALTRAKRKVFLMSSDTAEEPTFLKWINQEHIDKLPPIVGAEG